MLNKLIKAGAIIGGVFVASEVISSVRQAQAFAGMHKVYPDEVDELVDAMDDKEYTSHLTPFKRAKCKLIKSMTTAFIEE